MRTNGIVGSTDFVMDFDEPETKIDLTSEREMATVTNTTKWKEIKKYIEGRISFWEQALPAGLQLGDVDYDKAGKQWVRANDAIFELKSLLNTIEGTSNAVRTRTPRV